MTGYSFGRVSEPVRSRSIAWFEKLISECERRGASDVHLTAGCSPWVRINDKLQHIHHNSVVTAEQLHAIAKELLAGSNRDSLGVTGAVDGSCRIGNSRFRFNIFRQRSGLSIAFRRLENEFRSLAELGLPQTLYRLCDLSDGLVIMAGPTGAGKSTTLATLLDRINHTREAHIVTIEEPVEFVHDPNMCLVHQREVGIDASSFNDALVAALRQDPDVIMVGEMRDENTIRTAVRAGETGHLVFATLHAANSIGALERLLGALPTGEQEGMRRQLSAALRAVIVQHLLPTRNTSDFLRPSERRSTSDRRQRLDSDYGGDERRVAPRRNAETARHVVPACEILFSTPAISNLIASGELGQIYQYIESGSSHGMQTLERSLAGLCAGGTISETAALSVTRRPQTVRNLMAHMRQEGKSALHAPQQDQENTSERVFGYRNNQKNAQSVAASL